MKVEVSRSPDRRLRTATYTTNLGESFCVAEEIPTGTLLTEFNLSGEVMNQVLGSKKDAKLALNEYLGSETELEIIDTNVYNHVRVGAVCTKCGSEKIERALDQQDAKSFKEVPVVPLFVCKNCDTKFYSMTESYLRQLVSKNDSLFEKNELAEREASEEQFMKTLQEYIIRIFASKKIQRLRLK